MDYELFLYANSVLIATEYYTDYMTAEISGFDWVSENEDDNSFTIYPDIQQGLQLRYD